MARFPEFATEFQFVESLVSEQSVFCLPGKVCKNGIYFSTRILMYPLKIYLR